MRGGRSHTALRDLPDFINAYTEAALINSIEQQSWLHGAADFSGMKD